MKKYTLMFIKMYTVLSLMKYAMVSSGLFWALMVNVVSASARITTQHYRERKDMRERLCPEGILAKFTHVPSTLDCAQICLADIDALCLSYFYNKEKLFCITVDKFLTPEFACDPSEGYRYFAVTVTECPEEFGYTFDIGSKLCYKYYDMKERFSEARKTCHSDHGELIKLDTDAKMKVIIEYIKNVVESADTYHEYFIGGRYSINEGVWRWVVDNSTVADFNKADIDSCCLELESNDDEIQSYGEEKNISLDDTSCTDELQRFFCEAVISQ